MLIYKLLKQSDELVLFYSFNSHCTSVLIFMVSQLISMKIKFRHTIGVGRLLAIVRDIRYTKVLFSHRRAYRFISLVETSRPEVLY